MLDRLSPPIRGLIVDMDGVLWKDSAAIGDLPSIFRVIESRRLKITLATNNATMTVEENRAKLRGFGVHLEAWQIVTSSEAVAHTLAGKYPNKTTVFVVGEKGVIEVLQERGFVVITDPMDKTPVKAVVGGLDRALTYQKLQRAVAHIRAGATFYGTNPDRTFPTPQGLVPGAGSILAALAAASEVQPIVMGKPEPFLFQLASERMTLTKDEILVVGDRIETDIQGGSAWGARTALVLSGVSTREQARAGKPTPNLIAANLADLVGA